MPFITVSNGLTLKVPTRGTTDWDSEFLADFAEPISGHQHTGAGDGAQLGGGSIQDDSLDDRKTRLRNDRYLRGRNAAGSADIDIIKVNASDELELASLLRTDGMVARLSSSFTNNQTVAANIGISIATGTSVKLKYKIERTGTASLSEFGTLEVHYRTENSAFELIQEYSGDDSGLTFSMSGTDLQYKSTDNPGSSSETIYFLAERFGV